MAEQVATRLDQALARRGELLRQLGGDTDAWRIVHGSGDGLEGLTADRLGGAILVERYRKDAPADQLSVELQRHFGPVPIFVKERWSRDPVDLAGKQVRGARLETDDMVVRELGSSFAVRLAAGEHVGLFLDARPARALVRERAAGSRVLNLFSYTGGFGVAAARGGARSTTNVDAKRSALDTARRNYELNGLASDTRTFLRDDVIRHLARAARGAGRYDLVVLDPPPRFRRAGGRAYDTREGYGRLVTRCLRVVAPGGMLLAGSNVFGAAFERLERIVAEAARTIDAAVEVVDRALPGSDFPPAAERPTCVFSLFRVARPGTGR